jgi:transketolase
MDTMRERFERVTSELLDSNSRLAVVTADIGAGAFGPARERHPDRVINLGIREQLLIGVTSGLALTGMRPNAPGPRRRRAARHAARLDRARSRPSR